MTDATIRKLGLAALLPALLAAGAAAADTVYKYRRPDGRVVYSNRPVPRLELIETFDYQFSPAAPPDKAAAKSAAEGEARIRDYLATLEAAWNEVQAANKALAAAEARLRAEEEPQAGERTGVASGSASPATGGVPAASPPAVGGPMSGRRGRANPEYVARMQALEGEVASARARLDAALKRYNSLR
jgi:Tfp pilus assembly protein FimV